MANFMDYIEWRGDVDLKTSPLNEVDALILCHMELIISITLFRLHLQKME